MNTKDLPADHVPVRIYAERELSGKRVPLPNFDKEIGYALFAFGLFFWVATL